MTARHLITIFLRTLVLGVAMLGAGVHAARAVDDFLEPEKAFRFSARAQGERSVEVMFDVAPGYYLYREQFRFEALDAKLGAAALPAGKVKFDETFQKDVETYRDQVHITVPIEQAAQRFRVTVTSQGCADKGLCYPPMQSAAELSLIGFGGDGSARVLAASEIPAPGQVASVNGVQTADINAATPGDASRLGAALRGGHFGSVVGVFFLAGVLLSLTPCVLPMLPILSSIIVGQGGAPSRSRSFLLALSYSLGMALVYTSFGVAAGLAGEGLAASLQNPWVLGAFAAGLVGLSLSMFGVYELQLPAALTSQLAGASQRLPAGRAASVFAMGGVSALIVSPCVAAPLAGALVYLSQTRDVWLGGSALFALACGMSVPLLMLGASAGALLPKAGAWMDEVKRFFGVLLLGVALWTVQSVLPAPLVLALWGVLALATALLVFGRLGAVPRRAWRMVLAAVLALVALMQFVGAASGGADPLQPLAHLKGGAATAAPRFTAVHSVAELDAALQSAGRVVMLDFYADWCVSCKEMERFTFSDPAVQQKLAGALLLKADVTKNNADDRELLKRFSLFGPPGTIFFDARGREVDGTRVIGFQNGAQFMRSLAAAGL